LTGAALLLPYAAWVFVMEREIFSRLPLVVVTGLFLLALQAYFAGTRQWLVSRKPRRVVVTCFLVAMALGRVALLVAPSIILCLALCETAYRRAPLPRRLARLRGREGQLALTAIVMLVLFPAMNALYAIQGGLRRMSPLLLMRNPFYEINADGFRGPRLPRARTPGVVRLLFLGDSTTFGWPYRYGDTYVALVGADLAERGLGPVEVINAGVPGQSIVQIRNKLDRQLEYGPDVVFLMDGIHFEKSVEHLDDALRYSGGYEDHSFRPRFYPPALVELAVLAVATHPLRTMRGRDADPRHLAQRAASNERIAGAHLDGLADALRRRGIPLVLLEYPSRQVPPPVREQQRRAAGREGVTMLPLLRLFPDTDGYSFRDGVHPDKAGHRRIAAAIVHHLLARGWPPGAPGTNARKGLPVVSADP
jgi:lysophospholipase L1-like esterase